MAFESHSSIFLSFLVSLRQVFLSISISPSLCSCPRFAMIEYTKEILPDSQLEWLCLDCSSSIRKFSFFWLLFRIIGEGSDYIIQACSKKNFPDIRWRTISLSIEMTKTVRILSEEPTITTLPRALQRKTCSTVRWAHTTLFLSFFSFELQNAIC